MVPGVLCSIQSRFAVSENPVEILKEFGFAGCRILSKHFRLYRLLSIFLHDAICINLKYGN